MPLGPCPECGHQVARSAEACPNCGNTIFAFETGRIHPVVECPHCKGKGGEYHIKYGERVPIKRSEGWMEWDKCKHCDGRGSTGGGKEYKDVRD